MLCSKHGTKMECAAGRSAHISNWYCPDCAAEASFRRGRSQEVTGWLAYNDPVWTDKEPYCNTIRFIRTADAAAYVKRTHEEQNHGEWPYSDEQAVEQFKTVHWAWDSPPPSSGLPDTAYINYLEAGLQP